MRPLWSTIAASALLAAFFAFGCAHAVEGGPGDPVDQHKDGGAGGEDPKPTSHADAGKKHDSGSSGGNTNGNGNGGNTTTGDDAGDPPEDVMPLDEEPAL